MHMGELHVLDTSHALFSWLAARRPLAMKITKKRTAPKAVWTKIRLRLPDLDHAKAAVLNSLRSPESQRSYQHAIDEFITWYCSEPRLSFNKTVVTRYRIHLESRELAPGTVNVRLASVRRLAYEAADSGLLSPELAAGIRRVKGAKRLGVRLGNRLTAEEARMLWQRSLRSFSSALLIMRSSSSGTSGFKRTGNIGVLVRMAVKMTAEVLPVNACWPVAIS
jgi:hypothetical protein